MKHPSQLDKTVVTVLGTFTENVKFDQVFEQVQTREETTREDVKASMKWLTKYGNVETTGHGRGTTYRLVNSELKETETRRTRTTNTLTARAAASLVFNNISQETRVSPKEVVTQCNTLFPERSFKASSFSGVLSEMERDGHLFSEGKGPNRKYYRGSSRLIPDAADMPQVAKAS